MSAVTKNGAPRKQLSDQLDRLDGVIDALDEGLKGAVADAVREAVGAAVSQAVQAVLMELMTNPELQKATRQTPQREQDDEPPKPPGSLLSRAWQKVRSAGSACAGGLKRTFQAARLAWSLAGERGRAVAVAAATIAAGAAYAARAKIACAMTAAVGFAKGLIVSARGSLVRLAPALAA
jgi:hypothetical protein